MRIAQITDLHFREQIPGRAGPPERDSRAMRRLFPEALAAIRRQAPDFLAVTGDLLDVPVAWLSQDPAAPGCREEAALTAADYRWIRDQLDAAGIGYQVLPGNHDWLPVFEETFADITPLIEFKDWRFAAFYDREHENHHPRRVDPELSRWAKLLTDRDGPPQVHLQHYVIAPTINDNYPHNYVAGGDLAQSMGSCGRIPLSLSGHYHPGTPMTPVGATVFATAPAFCESPFRWRIYAIASANGPVTMEEYALAR